MQQQKRYDEEFNKVLQQLNEQQARAVSITEGPVLVVAGPGTGKTQILAARIGNILRTTDTKSHNILCLTFTEAGSVAMRKRLLEFIGPEAYNIDIFTFHAFCNQVIKENLDYFGVMDLEPASDLEVIEVIDSVIEDLPADSPIKRFTGNVYFDRARLRSLFDLMKREDYSPQMMAKVVDDYIESLPEREDFQYKRKTKEFRAGDPNPRLIKDVTNKVIQTKAAALEFDNYVKKMHARQRYDYNDMIRWVLNAFRENEDMLRNYQEKYHYFLVDEYQDTNGAQNEIINLLNNYWDAPNVFVVGDDDQSIFRFQGANVQNISDYSLRYKDALHTVVLTQNYRSSQPILDAAMSLIDYNNDRLVNLLPELSKDLVAKGSNSKISALPEVVSYYNLAQEEVAIADAVSGLKENGVPAEEIAIIYRNHKQVENLERVFNQRNIPLNIRRKVDILKEPLIDNIIILLRYLSAEYKQADSGEHLLFDVLHFDFIGAHFQDIAVLSRYVYEQRRSGQKTSWRKVLNDLPDDLPLTDRKALKSAWANLAHWMTELPNLTVQVLFEKIITRGGVLTGIMQSSERTWYMQVVTTFFNFIKEESAKYPRMTTGQLLETIDRMINAGLSLQVQKVAHAKEGVHFVTAHSSKGLEYDYVFMIGCTKNIWAKSGPRNQYKYPDTLISTSENADDEEGRRLFYVAMTRARKQLAISYAEHDNNDKPLDKAKYVSELIEGGMVKTVAKSPDNDELARFQAEAMMNPDLPAPELIDHELISKTLENYKLSVTDIKKYLKCPVMFYFEKIVRVPAARTPSMGFGNAVHFALEQYFKEMIADEAHQFPGAERLVALFEKGMRRYHSHFTEMEYDNYITYGRQILPEFHDYYVNDWAKVTLLEYPITTHIGEVPISGKLDKLEFNGKEINVVDYKTGSADTGKSKLRKPSDKNPDGEDYWRQIVFYKILMDNNPEKDWEMVSGEMDFIQKSKVNDSFIKRKIYVSPEDVAFVTEQTKKVYQKIMQHEFTQGCGDENCQWCNFVKRNFSEANKLVLGDEDEE